MLAQAQRDLTAEQAAHKLRSQPDVHYKHQQWPLNRWEINKKKNLSYFLSIDFRDVEINQQFFDGWSDAVYPAAFVCRLIDTLLAKIILRQRRRKKNLSYFISILIQECIYAPSVLSRERDLTWFSRRSMSGVCQQFRHAFIMTFLSFFLYVDQINVKLDIQLYGRV